MSQGTGQRRGAIVGAGVFVLAVLFLLLFAEPGMALLAGLALGVAAGTVVFVAGSLPRAAGEAAGRVAAGETPAAAGAAGGGADQPPSRDLSDTARLTPEEVLKVADLHQTIRLDQPGLDFVLPEVSPESILADREGIDEAFLRAGMGIEEGSTPSENVSGPAGGPEGTP